MTLIEILVAVVILAIGLLGVAGLQLLGLRGSMSASQRTVASLVASDMADRMRANIAAANAGAYGSPLVIDTRNAVATDCYTTTCTSDAQAAFDLLVAAKAAYDGGIADSARRNALAKLPNARVAVCRDDDYTDEPVDQDNSLPSPPDFGSNTTGCPNAPPAGAPYAIKIWWQERGMGGGEVDLVTRQMIYVFQP